MSRKTRILFIGESVTLTHIVRPLTLARALPLDKYEVHFACDDRNKNIKNNSQNFSFSFHSIYSLDGNYFLKNILRGSPAFRKEILELYVKDDLRVIDLVEPDVIVGDFRLSLSVSAKVNKVIYLTLGSSGNVNALKIILDALGDMPVQVVLSTLGRIQITPPTNVKCTHFLPGKKATERANVVICNGGSAAYQALSRGKPVLGICSLLDNFLSMQGITENKAGICPRASKLNKSLVKSALERLLHDKTYSLQAKKLSNRFLEYDALNKFRNILETHLSAKNQINPL